MILYGSIGNPVSGQNGMEIQTVNKNYSLTTYEKRVWWYLYCKMSTETELEREFQKEDNHQDYLIAFDRLKQRRLIVAGSGNTKFECLYDLFKKTVVQSFNISSIRLFMYLTRRFFRNLSLKRTLAEFKKLRLSADEKILFKLSLTCHKTPIEVINFLMLDNEQNMNADLEENIKKVTIHSYYNLYHKKMIILHNK